MIEFLLSNVRILMNFFHRREKDKKEIAIHHHPNHGLDHGLIRMKGFAHVTCQNIYINYRGFQIY